MSWTSSSARCGTDSWLEAMRLIIASCSRATWSKAVRDVIVRGCRYSPGIGVFLSTRYTRPSAGLSACQRGGLMHRLIIGLMLVGQSVAAGQPADSSLKFEVASIKRNRSGSDMVEGGTQPGGRANARNVTLVNLMIMAYAMPPD